MTLTAVRSDTYLHHLAFESPDPEKLAFFYGEVLEMTVKKVENLIWKCEGPKRKIIFHKGTKKKLVYAGFSCRDKNGLDEIKSRAISEKITIEKSISYFFSHNAFGVRDPDNNLIIFGLGNKEKHSFKGSHAPLQHLTFASKNVEAFEHFYSKKLGFSVSDRVMHKDGSMATCFTRSNHEHHTIACFKSKNPGVDHHSYETGEWSRIRDWCDKFSNLGIQLMWGPGRHGPGNNLFIFIEDPDKNWIEISAELEVVHDRPPQHWQHEPKTLNLWGPHSIMRS